MTPVEQIDRRIQAFLGRIRLAFRGVINLVNAAGAVQFVSGEGLSGEPLRDDELFQHYGLTSNLPAGTMCIVLPLGGRTAHGVIIATEHGGYRFKGLASGEVALYTQWNGDGIGHRIVLKQGGQIEVRGTDIDMTASGTLRLAGADVQIHASHSYSWDCAGYGERWTASGGGAWEHKTWQIGATITPAPLPIHPPEGPA